MEKLENYFFKKCVSGGQNRVGEKEMENKFQADSVKQGICKWRKTAGE